MVDPGFTIEGPYDQNGNKAYSFELPVYTLDDSMAERETGTNRESMPGQKDKEAILTPISGSRSQSLSGEISYRTIDAQYPGLTRKESVRRYIRKLEAIVLKKQGSGWQVVDHVRNRTYTPAGNDRGFLIEEIGWEHSVQEPGKVTYDIDLVTASGVQKPDDPNAYISSRSSGYGGKDKVIVDGTEIVFDVVESRRLSRSVSVERNDRMHIGGSGGGDDDDDGGFLGGLLGGGNPIIGIMESGVESDMSIQGTVITPTDFEGTVKDFDNKLHGKEAEFRDSMSGVVWTGAITSSSSTLNAGEPKNRFDVSLDLQVGNVVTGGPSP